MRLASVNLHLFKTAVLIGSCVPAASFAQTIDTVAQCRKSISEARNGNVRGAASIVSDLLRLRSNDPAVKATAAALLTISGEWEGGRSFWNDLKSESFMGGLANYGLGLVALARGEINTADNAFGLATANGDRTSCMILQRYIDSLAPGSVSGMNIAVPNGYRAPALGLSGFAAIRSGDLAKGERDLMEALSIMTGDSWHEPNALVMTGNRTSAISSGVRRLPSGHGLIRRGSSLPSTNAGVNGYVTISTAYDGSDQAYAVFRIDGMAAAIINTRPMQFVLDTRRYANGSHVIEVIVYDRSGVQVSRADQEWVFSNRDATTQAIQIDESVDSLIQEIWRLLLPVPSRADIYYRLADIKQSQSDRAGRLKYLERCVAVDPSYRDAAQQYISLTRPEAGIPIWRGPDTTSKVALTFDDGPKPGVTELLVDILVRFNAPSTFFVIGRHVTAYPSLITTIANAGMEIANHTYTHPNLSMLGSKDIEAELLQTMAAVRDISGLGMRYYRPPGGNTSPAIHKLAARWGLTACMWTIDCDSVEESDPERIADYVLQRVRPGSIVLMHNGRMPTVKAMPRILQGLKERGLTPVTVSDLMKYQAKG